MEFRILGPLEVIRDGHPLSLGGAKQRALLAILVLHANQVVSADGLIDLLWGEEAPPTAGNTLQVYISQLRKTVEPTRASRGPSNVIARRPPGYVLQADEDDIDARRFARRVEEGRAALAEGRYEDAASVLRDALAQWRGPALADFTYEPFAQSEITRLEELRMAAIEDRISADLALGRHASFIGELDALVAQYPLREALRGHLMLALYRSGRQAEALQVYQDTRRALDEELGIDPSSALQHLHQGILVQDSGLELAPRTIVLPEAAACENCGAPVAADGDLCDDCAAASVRQPLFVRKTVSVLSCEVALSSARADLDPEAMQVATDRLAQSARAVVERHGGTMAAPAYGDHFVAVFGVPALHEDDALRALSAASEVRSTLTDVAGRLEPAWQLEVELRLAVNTGEIVVDASAPAGAFPSGEAVTRTVRLGRAAPAGEILVTDATRHLT
jgi:DNA-binding SARP family transcriptional activator/class 3 adenylate cyclase